VPAIDLRGISRVFGSSAALCGVDLVVPTGSIVLLWGPNGSGKSTLMRIVATLIAPTFGRGAVLGSDLRRDQGRIRTLVELVSHRTRLYEDLTPREHLGFVAAIHHVDAGSVDPALERAGVAHVADTRIRGLSQGTRQRVALARTLIRPVPLLLLDEPAAGLDDAGRLAVDAMVADRLRAGLTTVVATHDVERVAQVAELAIELDRGCIRSVEALADRRP
jgi:ABC-type multidrug transport system ATPase subunit